MIKFLHFHLLVIVTAIFGIVETETKCIEVRSIAVCNGTTYGQVKSYLREQSTPIGLRCITCGAVDPKFLLDIDEQEHRWKYIHWINQTLLGKFNQLGFLITIELDNNNYILDSSTLKNNKRLENFYFRRNPMETLPEDLFKYNKNLKEIEITYNRLKTLPKDIFKSCRNLEIIDLSNNDLSMIPWKIFENNKNLTHVNLQNNRLTALPLIDLPKIIYLKFGNNPIIAINAKRILNLKTLRLLDFHNLPYYTVKEKILDFCFFTGHCSLQWADKTKKIRYLMIKFDINNPNGEKYYIASYYNFRNRTYIKRQDEWASNYVYGVRCIDYCGRTLLSAKSLVNRNYIFDLIEMLKNDFHSTIEKNTLTVQAMAALESLEELKNSFEQIQCQK